MKPGKPRIKRRKSRPSRLPRTLTSATIAVPRLRIQIDGGLDDVITPGAFGIEPPALLNLPAPLCALSQLKPSFPKRLKRSASLGVGNSRITDFHDLWMIGQTVTFEFAAVADAIQQTFEGRRTSLSEQRPADLSNIVALVRKS